MNTNSYQNYTELNLKQFRIRNTAKLCICFVCLISFLYRVSALLWDSSLTARSTLLVKISLPLCAMIIVIIALEYFLFRKKGSSVAKYSSLVDFILLLFFVGDWISFLLVSLYRVDQLDSSSIKIPVVLGFTAFSWRTLLVTLLVQKWQLKIIAPIPPTFLVIGYAIHYAQGSLAFVLLRAAIQLICIIVIICCQEKVVLKLMRMNIEQEKWMQVNNFIFDNIPENIVILDLNGEAKFMSEYCTSFLRKYNESPDVKDFSQKVRNLQPLGSGSDPLCISTAKIEKMTTGNEFYIDLNDSEPTRVRVESLQNLILNFSQLIKSKNLQERQFLVYNGKFKAEAHSPEKAIEMKISFVQNYKNDYIILIFRDTTQRDLIVKLEETNNYKDQLLASVSHELRAPLNGNINLVEGALNSSEIPQDLKETLLIPALQSSKFLLHIINDIIDLSQIKQKKLSLALQSEDLKETLKDTAQLVELQARKKGLDFLVEIDSSISPSFNTDHLRVSQVVLNLLTNAVKFTNEGEIKLIAVKLKDTSSVKITVEDSGIGMSQENLQKLFSHNPIAFCEGKDRINPTGTGLGLNVATNLVELLAPENQNKIEVLSTPNKGSTFTFILESKTIQRSKTPAFDNSSSEDTEELTTVIQLKTFNRIKTLTSFYPSSPELKRIQSEPLTCLCPKILIVDDNPFNTMALETILCSLKIKCESVFNGASAVQKLILSQNKTCGEDCKYYSVVFMDQEMPGMSGEETVKEIKKLQEENKLLTDIRIIGCTALKAKEEVDRFLASGLESCIFKPVSISVIKNILKEILE